MSATEEVQPNDWNLTYGEVARALAELRHAYWNLVRPDDSATWDKTRRQAFADGLIAPQIKRLERVQEHHSYKPVKE